MILNLIVKIQGLAPQKTVTFLKKQVKQIETQIQFKIKNSAALNSKASRLQQIQGFGVITSASLLARSLPRIITR